MILYYTVIIYKTFGIPFENLNFINVLFLNEKII